MKINKYKISKQAITPSAQRSGPEKNEITLAKETEL